MMDERIVTQGVIGLAILAYGFSGEGRTVAKVIGGAVVARSAFKIYKRRRELLGGDRPVGLLERPPADASQAPPSITEEIRPAEQGGLRLVD